MAGKKEAAPPAADPAAPDPLAALDAPAPAANGTDPPAPAAGDGAAGDDASLPAVEGLTDEQIFAAFQDPRAAVLLDYVTGTQQSPLGIGSSPAAAPAPAAPHSAIASMAADPAAEVDWTNLAKLAEEGDTNAIRTLATSMAEKTAADKAVSAAREAAMVEARKQFYGELAALPEMQNLTPSEALNLMTAMRQGPGEFVRAVSGVLVTKSGGAAPAAAGDDAAVADAYGRVAANQQAGAPNLPPAAPVTGAPTPDGTTKEAPYDVFSRILEWEAQEAAVVPQIPK